MLHRDEWLSRYFPGGAYRYTKSEEQSIPILQEGFVYTKIPTEMHTELNYLVKSGFDLVELLVLFEQRNPVIYKPTGKIDIGFVKGEEEREVVEIAKNAFLASRFFQDRRISSVVASQIKGEWVANFFSGQRGDNLIVARVNGDIAGFLLLINKTTIDLIAVSPSYYRQGIASSMIGFANQTTGLLTAGTQLTNNNSIAMYEKCGFFFKNAQFVLHKFYGKI